MSKMKVLEGLKRSVLELKIKGLSPLLCDKPPDVITEDDGEVGPKTRTVKKQFEDSIYWMEHEGKKVRAFPLGMALNLGCAQSVGVLKGTGQAKSKGAGVLSIARVKGSIIALDCDDRGMRPIIHKADPVMFTTAIRKQQGGRIQHTRARFNDWEMSVMFQYRPEMVSKEIMALLIDAMGSCLGLGSWRLSSGGVFGRFTATSLKVVPNEIADKIGLFKVA